MFRLGPKPEFGGTTLRPPWEDRGVTLGRRLPNLGKAVLGPCGPTLRRPWGGRGPAIWRPLPRAGEATVAAGRGDLALGRGLGRGGGEARAQWRRH